MHRAGRYLVIAGLVLSLVGLLAGFGALAMDEDRQAVRLLLLVPLGFAGMLTGIVITQFNPPHGKDE